MKQKAATIFHNGLLGFLASDLECGPWQINEGGLNESKKGCLAEKKILSGKRFMVAVSPGIINTRMYCRLRSVKPNQRPQGGSCIVDGMEIPVVGTTGQVGEGKRSAS